jgi:hypothetical protein
VFEHKVPRIFGPKKDEVTWQSRRLHREERYSLYSPNITRVIKSERRWTGNVARMGTEEVPTEFWWGNLKEGGHLEDLGVDGRIILNWIFEK